MNYNSLIIICWLAFLLYWIFSAFGVKKDISRRRPWVNFVFSRLILIVGLIFVARFIGDRNFWRAGGWETFSSVTAINILGVALCALGVALAIWARAHLGRNWSGHPTIKQDHELVTTGPYAYVRHPIYTGMLMALLGTTLVGGPVALIILIVVSGTFIMRIEKEEGFMMQLFPEQYVSYKQHTKKLVPFIW